MASCLFPCALSRKHNTDRCSYNQFLDRHILLPFHRALTTAPANWRFADVLYSATAEHSIMHRAVTDYFERFAVPCIHKHRRSISANEHRFTCYEMVVVVKVEEMRILQFVRLSYQRQ